MALRRVEWLLGVIAGGLGVIAIFTGLFAPLSTQCTATTSGQSSCTMVSLVQVQGLSGVLVPLEVFVVLSLGVALFAAWHSTSRNGMALVLLWVSIVLLCFNTLLAIASIGLLFLPADLLALAAGIIGTVAATERPRAHA